MNTNQLHTINLDLFDKSITLVVADWKKAKRLLKKELSKEDYTYLIENEVQDLDVCSGFFLLLPSIRGLIWIDEATPQDKFLEVLSHEIMHCTIGMLDRLGVVMCSGSEEVFAYINGYITIRALGLLGLTLPRLEGSKPKPKRNPRTTKKATKK